MRKPIIAGNWKMNKCLAEAEALASGIINRLQTLNFRLQTPEIVLCPPFTALYRLSEILKGSDIKLGAQNLFYEDNGPWTGEISASQLVDMGCKYVIIGHSERRQCLKETDEIINKKVKQALKHNLFPILCVGETEKERDEGREKDVVEKQLRLALKDINYENFPTPDSRLQTPDPRPQTSFVIAYEPIWAIGTGNTCNPEDAENIHITIRKLISNLYNKDLADSIRIQYGGSVKPDNIDAIMKMPNIDGALVGGASLDVFSFCRIVEFRNV